MSATAQLSFTNYIAGSTILSFTSQQSAWPVDLLKGVEPMMPWRSTSTAAQDILFDFLTVKPAGPHLIVVNNINFTKLEFAFDNDGTFAPPDHDVHRQARLVQDTGRYNLGHLVHMPPGIRYLLLRIAAQSTTDGASFFQAGHLHVGPIDLAMPRGLRWDFVRKPFEGFEDLRGRGGVQRGRLQIDDPYVVIRGSRFGTIRKTSPGSADELEAWQAIDRATRENPTFAYYENKDHAGHAWTMRRTSDSEWKIGYPIAESDLTLEEVIVP